MIKLNKVDKYYNRSSKNALHVLNDISLDIPSTGLTVILGHSGSGKTTLLNVIGGLDKADGEIIYDDFNPKKSVRKMDNYRSKNIGYIFQNYNLFYEYTVYENLDIALGLYGVMSPEEKDKRIRYCLKAVGMEKFARRSAIALSGGQQQRVAIARALVKNCPVLIADEPTGNLDSRNTQDIIAILKTISKTKAVILVTHERDLALAYADRIIEIVDGKITNYYENAAEDATIKDAAVDKVIYEGDLTKETIEEGLIKVNTFSDQLPDKKVEISLYFHQGAIYLKAGNDVNVITQGSEIVIKEGKYVAKKASDIPSELNFDFDNEAKLTFKDQLSRIYAAFKKAFLRFIYAGTKGSRFFHVVFVIIGIVLAITSLSFFIFYTSTVKRQDIIYTKDGEAVAIKPYDSLTKRQLDDLVCEWFDDGAVTNVAFESDYENIVYVSMVTSVSNTNIPSNKQAVLKPVSYRSNFRFLAGSKITKPEEVVIEKWLADALIDTYYEDTNINLSYNDLVGRKIQIGILNNDLVVKGVVSHESYYVYIQESLYHSFWANQSFRGDPRYFENTIPTFAVRNNEEIITTRNSYIDNKVNVYINSIFEAHNPFYSAPFNDFNIIGSVAGSADMQIYFATANDYDKYLEQVADELLVGDEFFPISVYKALNISQKALLFSESNRKRPLKEGRAPVANTEIIIADSIYKQMYGNQAFAEFTTRHGTKIVGTYEANLGFENVVYATSTALAKYRYFYLNHNKQYELSRYTILATANTQNANVNYFKDDLVYSYMYLDALYSEVVSDIRESFRELLIVLGVITVILFLMIFFPMRSKTIKNIYPLGVYRALGAKRFKLARLFIVDAILLASLTTVPAYFGTLAFFKTLLAPFDIAVSNFYLTSGILIFIYGAFILFGTLPIIMLLRKKPAEILAKYDI